MKPTPPETPTPTPITDAFMTLIDDSEVDLGMIEAKLGDMEIQLAQARAEVEEARNKLAAFAGHVAGLGALSFHPQPKHIEPLLKEANGILNGTGEPKFITQWRQTEAERDRLRAALEAIKNNCFSIENAHVFAAAALGEIGGAA